MPFQQKSAAALLVSLLLASVVYVVVMLAVADGAPASQVALAPLVVTSLALAVLVAGSHIIMAVWSAADANEVDERDRLIELRGKRNGGVVLSLGVFAGMALAVAGSEQFWIANLLFVALVLAEIVAAASKLVDYRRGV